jgi:hypothetical protein
LANHGNHRNLRWENGGMYSKEEIGRVLHEHRLCANGYVYSHRKAGEWVTAGIIGDDGGWNFEGMVNFAAKRMSEVRRIISPKGFAPSYPLKHLIERSWTPQDAEIAHGYVCNGAVIVAAYLMGVKVLPAHPWHPGPNALLGISSAHCCKLWER